MPYTKYNNSKNAQNHSHYVTRYSASRYTNPTNSPYGSRVSSYNNRYQTPMYRQPRINLNANIYPVTRYVPLDPVTADTTDQFYTFNFQLEDVPGYTELNAMYDRYKICAVKISFIPISNVTLHGSSIVANTEYNHRIFSVIDYNVSTDISTIDEMRQYKTCRWSPNNKIHTRYLKPKPFVDNATLTPANVFQTTANDNVFYRGLRVAVEANGSDYKVEAKYYLMFKDPK